MLTLTKYAPCTLRNCVYQVAYPLLHCFDYADNTCLIYATDMSEYKYQSINSMSLVVVDETSSIKSLCVYIIKIRDTNLMSSLLPNVLTKWIMQHSLQSWRGFTHTSGTFWVWLPKRGSSALKIRFLFYRTPIHPFAAHMVAFFATDVTNT
jgi:hypothetical protein